MLLGHERGVWSDRLKEVKKKRERGSERMKERRMKKKKKKKLNKKEIIREINGNKKILTIIVKYI